MIKDIHSEIMSDLQSKGHSYFHADLVLSPLSNLDLLKKSEESIQTLNEIVNTCKDAISIIKSKNSDNQYSRKNIDAGYELFV